MKKLFIYFILLFLCFFFVSCNDSSDLTYYLETDENTEIIMDDGSVNAFINGIDNYDNAWTITGAYEKEVYVNMEELLSRKFFKNILNAQTIPYEEKKMESNYHINFSGDTYACHFWVFVYVDGLKGRKFGICIFTSGKEKYSIDSPKDIKALYFYLNDVINESNNRMNAKNS